MTIISYVLKDAIKLRILRGEAYPGWAPKAITDILIRERQRETDMQRERWCEDKVRADTGVMQQQGTECRGQQKPEGAESKLSLGESAALLMPWFQTSVLQNRERIHFCCFKLQIHGNLLQQPRKLIQCLYYVPISSSCLPLWPTVPLHWK